MPVAPRKKALVIAVSDYENLDNLDFCKNDGHEMLHLLRELNYEIKNQDGLIGRVDGRLMQDCIYEFFKDDIKSDDTLLFYFSGHGVPSTSDFFLASSNIDQTKPKMRGFSFNDLTDEIHECNAKRVVIILDSCFAGSLKTSKSEESAMAIAAKNHQSTKFKEGEGKCLLSSCMGFQESFATVEGNHSFFTNYLIEGLRGAGGESVEDTGMVTPESLMRFIDTKIDGLPGDKRQNQTPFRKIESAGKILLASYPEFAKTTQPAVSSQKSHLISLLMEGKIKEFNEIREDDIKDLNLNPKELKKEAIIEKTLDFLEVNLSRKDLSGANLKFIVFRGANLEGAVLKNANLVGTEFSHSNLSGVDFSGAVFHEKIIRPTRGAEAHFFEIPKQGVDMERTRLPDGTYDVLKEFTVDFSNCDLRKAKFIGINTYFDKSDYFCILNFANSKMSEVDFSNSILRRMILKGLDISYSVFTNTDISNTEFEGTNLAHSSFINSICYNTNFVGAEMDNCDFTKANLSYSILRGTKLNNSNFRNANLTGVDLSGAELVEADFTNAVNLPISKFQAEDRGAII